MTDLTVKYFNSGMTGAPQIANNWGDLVTMLDACLVNGFALKAIDTLTFAAGIATATIAIVQPLPGKKLGQPSDGCKSNGSNSASHSQGNAGVLGP